MADPPRYPDPNDQSAIPSSGGRTRRATRPILVALVLLALLLLMVGLHLAGIRPTH